MLQVSTAGENIRGVVLCQELPHLSHLGVRSRQERIPFATCTSQDAIDGSIKPLLGKTVKLAVGSDSVSISESMGTPDAAGSTVSSDSKGPAKQSQFEGSSSILFTSGVEVIALADATLENSGAKAQVCGSLASLSKDLFRVPSGTVLPFGSMEAAVKQAGMLGQFEELLGELEVGEVGGTLDGVCSKLQALIREQCRPSLSMAAKVVASMKGIVIARSSANVEDLAGLSGAGLYESIPNLNAGDPESVATGIAQVWASLYSRRAVLSRRAAGIKQKNACMAVLVQV